MNQLFAGLHVPNKANEILELKNINFAETVHYLKDEIITIGGLECDGSSLDIVYNGDILRDDEKLDVVLRPNAIVHCFVRPVNKYKTYVPPPDVTEPNTLNRVQELFNVIAHIQIPVASRVNILQKILTGYPEFRRNLGAQALIRDSVLFNTLHTPDVVQNVAQNYPIIIEAASFIVDTVKKELTRAASLARTASTAESANESPNSSEDDSSGNDRSNATTENAAATAAANLAARLPAAAPLPSQITRQQLQAALANIRVLPNSAGSNSSASATAADATAPAATDRSAPDLLQLILNSMPSAGGASTAAVPRPAVAGDTGTQPTQPAQSETPSEETVPGRLMHVPTDMDTEDIPASYRTHQYADQLRTMAQMGFLNWEENLQCLTMTNGNIENAVNLIMSLMN